MFNLILKFYKYDHSNKIVWIVDNPDSPSYQYCSKLYSFIETKPYKNKSVLLKHHQGQAYFLHTSNTFPLITLTQFFEYNVTLTFTESNGYLAFNIIGLPTILSGNNIDVVPQQDINNTE